jgi:hypothetical protein
MSAWRRCSVAMVIAGSLAVAAPSAADAAPHARAAASTNDLICGALSSSEALSNKIKSLLRIGDGEAWYGALVANVVLSVASTECPRALSIAENVVGELFHFGGQPGPLSTAATYRLALSALSLAQIANALGTDPQYVRNSISGICMDVRLDISPGPILKRDYARARLVHLRALDALAVLAARSCSMSAAAYSSLTSTALQLTLASVSPADVDPPTSWFTGFTDTLGANGLRRVNSSFNGYDAGSGVDHYQVWISFNGAWHAAGHGAALTPGTRYQWAVQAVDKAGNAGPFTYSPLLQAR